VRFYAGRPLCAPGGLPVGTLCLFDVVPRSLDDAQLAVLDELGRWTEQELARSEEMERAREVQQALLPGRAPEVPGWEVAGLCLPAAAVGGDLYDLERLDDGLVLTLADVMGKGTGAAILMSGVRSVLRATAQTLDGALDRTGGEARLLTAANRTLLPDLARTGSFVTAFHARVDLSTGVVRYGDAGHGLAVVARAGGGTAHLAADDLPLGIADVEWTEHELQLDPGDTLLVFSDGLLDALGGTREAVAAVADLVAATPEPAQLVRAVRAVAEDAEPLDDVTAVALRRCPE
jgi:serine phosphatase RsbU (regulator of sigma subunit)